MYNIFYIIVNLNIFQLYILEELYIKEEQIKVFVNISRKYLRLFLHAFCK